MDTTGAVDPANTAVAAVGDEPPAPVGDRVGGGVQACLSGRPAVAGAAALAGSDECLEPPVPEQHDAVMEGVDHREPVTCRAGDHGPSKPPWSEHHRRATVADAQHAVVEGVRDEHRPVAVDRDPVRQAQAQRPRRSRPAPVRNACPGDGPNRSPGIDEPDAVVERIGEVGAAVAVGRYGRRRVGKCGFRRPTVARERSGMEPHRADAEERPCERRPRRGVSRCETAQKHRGAQHGRDRRSSAAPHGRCAGSSSCQSPGLSSTR